MKMRFAAMLLLLTCVLALGVSAAPEADEAPPPSFRAGADVTLGVTVSAPAAWVINPGVPFRVTFDKDALKQAGVKVDKLVQDFKLKNYASSMYVELPVKLNKDLRDGEVVIPFMVDCGICTADQESCTFSSGKAEVHVRIANTAVEGSKAEALKRGLTPAEYRLPLP